MAGLRDSVRNNGSYAAKVYSYEISTAAVNRPVSLDLVKEHLKIADNSQDSYLEILIDAASDFFESYTGRILINKGFTTYRDSFSDNFLIRRSKLVSIDSFEYLKNNVLTALNANIYKFRESQTYSNIVLQQDKSYPTDIDRIADAIKIVFTAGYGTEDTDIPSVIKLGLLNHIAFLYANRGDCSDCKIDNLSSNAKNIYDKYRIKNVGSETYGVVYNN